MNTSITLEQVQKSLDNINIPYTMIDIDEHGFSRTFKFKILGVVYYINWWSNISYLSVGCRWANSFPFTKIAKAPSHPSFDNAIAFCMKGKEDFHDKFHVGLSLHSFQKGEHQ